MSRDRLTVVPLWAVGYFMVFFTFMMVSLWALGQVNGKQTSLAAWIPTGIGVALIATRSRLRQVRDGPEPLLAGALRDGAPPSDPERDDELLRLAEHWKGAGARRVRINVLMFGGIAVISVVLGGIFGEPKYFAFAAAALLLVLVVPLAARRYIAQLDHLMNQIRARQAP